MPCQPLSRSSHAYLAFPQRPNHINSQTHTKVSRRPGPPQLSSSSSRTYADLLDTWRRELSINRCNESIPKWVLNNINLLVNLAVEHPDTPAYSSGYSITVVYTISGGSITAYGSFVSVAIWLKDIAALCYSFNWCEFMNAFIGIHFLRMAHS